MVFVCKFLAYKERKYCLEHLTKIKYETNFKSNFTIMSKVRDILGVDKESEFLQSFVRVGLTADQEDNEPHKSLYMQQKPHVTIAKQSSDIRSDYSDGKSPRRLRSSPTFEANQRLRRRRRDYYDEMYTDKDRAAAVSFG